MAKKLLNIEYEYDFALIGISCHEKDYRLCWNINQVLNIQLAKIDSLEIYTPKEKSKGFFSLFFYEDEENQCAYYLLSNRSQYGIVIPEQKQTDFFIIIKGSFFENDKTALMEELKKISIILTSFEINPNGLKSKKNLLF